MSTSGLTVEPGHFVQVLHIFSGLRLRLLLLLRMFLSKGFYIHLNICLAPLISSLADC